MKAKYYTLQTSDVGAFAIKAFGRSWPVVDFIGRVLPNDVGKRVYLREDCLAVENDTQLRAREMNP